MSLTSFSITNQKSVRHASVENVPRVMVIAGPNGIGKSTLLYAIKQGAGVITDGTILLYQGPHRVLRRTSVARRWLTGTTPRWFADLLVGGDVSGFEGLSFGNATRTPDNVDEAGSTIKYTLGKIENRRQTIHSGLIDRMRKESGTITAATLPDIYGPLKELTKYLLPHLEFSHVDFLNEDNIRALWTRKDASQTLEIDIDDLSSGEKSIIVLFLPLIEEQIRERIEQLETLASGTEAAETAAADRVFLVDEPEQHIHPDLQAKLLSYIRRVSVSSSTQFVLSTHSPTILDQATDQELFVMVAPSEDGAENQLKKIATNAERLEALKQIAGSTYFLTTGRVLVCIEGHSTPPDEMSDLSLLEIIYPRSTAFTLVPSGGKGNVISTVRRFQDHLPEDIFRIRVRGLVDADQTEGMQPGISVLPVCMIENFLLDPKALLTYCQSVGIDKFVDENAVLEELQQIMESMREEEIGRRVALNIKPLTVRIRGATLDQIKERHEQAVEEIKCMVPVEADLERSIAEATDIVAQLLSSGEAQQRFHGKTAMKEFYSRNIRAQNIGYSEACLGIAKLLAENETLSERLDDIFDQLVS